MVLGFKENFVDKILDGSKIHTIREDKKNRWKAGNKIHFATGIRSKDYNCFKEGKCFATEKIFIDKRKRIILIEGQELSETTMNCLAVNDGFKRTLELFSFFPEPFTGKIIHWTRGTYIEANPAQEATS